MSGVIAASQLSRRLGIKHAVAFDMGGTTAKAALIENGAAVMSEGYFVGDDISGHPVMLPVVDVIEVGAGGGSIAHLDEVGRCASDRRAPAATRARSAMAGEAPGRRSPTRRRAGRLNPGRFLGGEMPLDVENAAGTIGLELATRLGLSTNAAAQAVIDVAVNKMVLAVRAVSIERGLDPRDCALIAFGGACRCTPPPSPATSTSPLSSCRRCPATTRPSACSSPTSGTTTCGPATGGSTRCPATLAAMIAEMTGEGRALLEAQGLARRRDHGRAVLRPAVRGPGVSPFGFQSEPAK